MIELNYWAVLVSAVAAMVIGFLWYGPLFGKAWSRIMGWGELTKEEIKAKQKKATPGYIVQFIGALIMAYVLAHGIAYGNAYLDTEGVMAGLTAAFWYWLGFVAPVTIGSVLWDGKPMKLWYINGGYYLVLMLVMGAILGAWM